MRHQLDHIFIDECHLLLSNSVDFRKHMDNLKISKCTTYYVDCHITKKEGSGVI
jgi:hypothetical protein